MRTIFLLIACVLAAPAQEYRAFWADAFHSGYKSAAEVDRMVEDVAAAKGNAIVIEVRNRGGSYYLKSLEPPVEDAAWTPTFDALQYLIEKAHARGIEVHAWFPVTPLWPFTRMPADPRHAWVAHGPHAAGDAMWMTMTAGGKVSTSVDPGHPDVLRYLADLIVDPAVRYDIDGLHLDYIRYPEDDNYGWNPKAVERFNRLENRTGSPAAGDPKWSDFRRNQVTGLVRQIYLRSFEIRPAVKITGALITWGDGPASDAQYRTKDAYSRVFQDWRGWLEEGILDIGMPMNYFDNTKYSGYLDRWIAFEKDRQYRRRITIGLASYLNSIPDSMSQMQRALAPSAAGNRPLGLTFYSYASTNLLNAAGSPVIPNSEFYAAVANFYRDAAAAPALPWKAAPDRGHLLGTVTVDGGPVWLKDGLGVTIESDTGGSFSTRTVTDGSGFFGMVDLQPDRYRIRLDRGGVEIFRTMAQDLRAGQAIRFDVFLKDADFAAVTPRVNSVQQTAAAPGDVVTLIGSAFASGYAPARAVPLPLEIAGTQVLVNGIAAPLNFISPEHIELQLPFQRTDVWNIVVRRSGAESPAIQVAAVEANPVILGVRRVADRYLEIYATGLGLTAPPLQAGFGGAAAEPYNRVTLPTVVRVGGINARVLYSGLTPYQPARYQVNVELPDGVSAGEVVVQVGSASSRPFSF